MSAHPELQVISVAQTTEEGSCSTSAYGLSSCIENPGAGVAAANLAAAELAPFLPQS